MPGNVGKIDLFLKDVHGEFLKDSLTLEFRNQRLRSLDFRQPVVFQGKKVTLEKVPAFPEGLWQVTLLPQKYLFKSIFVSVPSNGTAQVNEVFFVDRNKVHPIFPSPEDLQNQARWKPLTQVIQNSAENGIDFGNLASEQMAGLLNLYAKMKAEKLSGRRDVWSSVEEIIEVKPARIFVKVSSSLWSTVRKLPQQFHAVPGVMHEFSEGWKRLEQEGSFKTPDRAGNLQLTFAKGPKGAWAVDADLDDHQGIQHAFDVIKHQLTGRDTHPYDIHQILVFFQGLEPGYDLV